MNLGVFKRRIDVDAEIQMTPLKSLYASGDKDAHVFELSIYQGAEEMDLSGASAQGYFIRADGYTVPITGTISGNVVTLTLSEGCYYIVGNFNLIIKVSAAESRKSVFWGSGYVVRSMTDAIVDEENVIPSLDELLAQIAAVESAAKAANQAASAANSAATSARQAASAAGANASAANSAANAAKAAATTATEAATKIDDMTITATGLAAGAAPTAKLTEVDGHYNIVLGLPKGDKGDPGATPQITVQVKTGEPGTAASVKQTGTAEAPVIELTIPRGDTGNIGSLTINGKAPDAAGKVELTAEDVGALSGTDATLTEAGKAADAKATGDEFNQLKTEKVAYSDALTLEEIEASTDLTGKVASAESAKDINTVVSTMGAISLGFILSGQFAKFRVDEIFFILFGPNSTTVCMDSYGTTASGFNRFVRSLTTSTDEYYTLTKETDGSFTLVNNVPWAVSYIVLGANCKLILK